MNQKSQLPPKNRGPDCRPAEKSRTRPGSRKIFALFPIEKKIEEG
jgi:hypothetical protein